MSRPNPPRIVPIRTVSLDSLDDLDAFQAALAKRTTPPPRVRIALRVPQLREAQSSEDERRINRLLTVRGYGGGAIGVVLLALATLGLHLLRPGGLEGHMLLWLPALAIVAAVTGQQIAARVAHRRLLALCRRVMQQALDRRP